MSIEYPKSELTILKLNILHPLLWRTASLEVTDLQCNEILRVHFHMYHNLPNDFSLLFKIIENHLIGNLHLVLDVTPRPYN